MNFFSKIFNFFSSLFINKSKKQKPIQETKPEPIEEIIEPKGRTERSHVWSLDDAVLTLYFHKFGVGRLGSIEQIAHEHICSTVSSLKMQSANMRYLLDIKRILGEDKFLENKRYKVTNHKVRGLSHFASNQREAIINYDKLSEPELRKIATSIMNKKTLSERKENIKKVRNRKPVNKNQLSMPL